MAFESQVSIGKVLNRLRRFDDNGGFCGMAYPQSLWYGVIHDPAKRRATSSGHSLAASLLICSLGGTHMASEIADLRLKVAKARTFDNQSVSFDGKLVTVREVGMRNVLL